MPSRGGAPECLALRHRRSHWRLPGGLLALVPGGSVPPHPTSRTEPLSARYRGLRTSSWTPFSAALGSCCLPRNATKVAFSPHIRQILLRLYSFLLPPLSPEDNGRTQSSFSRTQEHLNLFSPSCGKLQKKKKSVTSACHPEAHLLRHDRMCLPSGGGPLSAHESELGQLYDPLRPREHQQRGCEEKLESACCF